MLISNCTLNKVQKNHGTPFLEKKEKIFLINKTNKNDILQELGPPSTTSFFDNDLWIYIEQKKTQSSLFRFSKKKNLKNNVLVLEINNKGILSNKKLYTLSDFKNVKFSNKETFATDKDSFVYGFLSSLRQKIDSPKRRKKTRKQ